mgnify:CR=1 FL=1
MDNNLKGILLGGATGLIGGFIGGGLGVFMGLGPIITGISAAALALLSYWGLKSFLL